jgi:hypothetical protein
MRLMRLFSLFVFKSKSSIFYDKAIIKKIQSRTFKYNKSFCIKNCTLKMKYLQLKEMIKALKNSEQRDIPGKKIKN